MAKGIVRGNFKTVAGARTSTTFPRGREQGNLGYLSQTADPDQRSVGQVGRYGAAELTRRPNGPKERWAAAK